MEAAIIGMEVVVAVVIGRLVIGSIAIISSGASLIGATEERLIETLCSWTLGKDILVQVLEILGSPGKSCKWPVEMMYTLTST